MNKLPVLFATSELHPFVKTGGLADVSYSLPIALAETGVDVRILIPGYPRVLERLDYQAVAENIFPLPGLGPMRLLLGALPNTEVGVYVLECPALYQRDGGPYANAEGRDWQDNHLRFGALSRVAAMLGSDVSPINWRSRIVHCNDWQTALACAYLAFQQGNTARTLVSVHNLAFAGRFSPRVLGPLDLPDESFSMFGLEFYGDVSFLKAGLYYADHLTTVSPTYAREIQTEAFGVGFHGLLSQRGNNLTGILNGIDTEAWCPATDPFLERPYDLDDMTGKSVAKRRLQEACRFEISPEIPLIGMVTRLSHQKGIDLAASVIAALNRPAQFVILGSGDASLETGLRHMSERLPGRVSVYIGYNEKLAHNIEAGVDVFLMPSRYEPCGLNQMYSMRYGTPPIVRATGGLADSVIDTTNQTLRDHSATGFVFREPTAGALLTCLNRALDLFGDTATWARIQANGMRRDFSWKASARQYERLYRLLAQA